MNSSRPSARFGGWLAAGVGLVAIVLAGAALVVATQADSAPEVIIPTLPPSPTPTPVPNGAMWSIGTGGDDVNPYFEWVAVYPVSSMWNILGAPSIRFKDHDPDTPDRSFEIGFYKYGPTWYTRNFIVEFWVGGPEHGGGTLSVSGNGDSGGQLEARNPSDTDHITLDFRDANRPTLLVGPSAPLYLEAEKGIISESPHTLAGGFDVPPESGHAGQVVDGDWATGVLTVPTTAVRAQSLVLITPIGEPRGRWWVGDLIPGESFAVHSSAADEDMAFNWLIVN